MGTRQRNRLVSAIAAKQQLPPRRGFLGTRSGKPHARDPPLTEAAQWSATQQRRQGKDLPPAGPQTKRGRCGNITLSQRRTREASPVTASYVTW
jgi:hypothetical protein